MSNEVITNAKDKHSLAPDNETTSQIDRASARQQPDAIFTLASDSSWNFRQSVNDLELTEQKVCH